VVRAPVPLTIGLPLMLTVVAPIDTGTAAARPDPKHGAMAVLGELSGQRWQGERMTSQKQRTVRESHAGRDWGARAALNTTRFRYGFG
jgi:hypothetical protein